MKWNPRKQHKSRSWWIYSRWGRKDCSWATSAEERTLKIRNIKFDFLLFNWFLQSQQFSSTVLCNNIMKNKLATLSHILKILFKATQKSYSIFKNVKLLLGMSKTSWNVVPRRCCFPPVSAPTSWFSLSHSAIRSRQSRPTPVTNKHAQKLNSAHCARIYLWTTSPFS